MKKTYSIFGAGAAGLYTAWRLLGGKIASPQRSSAKANDKAKSKQLSKGDILELYDWGQYDFSAQNSGTREPGARVCTWHYGENPENSYVELGGMRYLNWDTTQPDPNGGFAPGHRLVTTVIAQLGLDKYAVPFNESDNPLFYLRTKNLYLNDISSNRPAPYNVNNYGAAAQPDQGFSTLEALSVTKNKTRAEWDAFYQEGRIESELPATSVFQKGDHLKDIGYWNLMYDQLGSEGFAYSADGNGYSSNVINWNAAVAFEANNEFTPGNQYMTITTGYSGMFTALFAAIQTLAKQKGVQFRYYPNTRLHSILAKDDGIHYTFAERAHPWKPAGERTTNAAWLAMPRHSLDLVARATRYCQSDGLDVLNHQKVQLYMESAIMQPSYKVGMFFHTPWWTSSTYPALLTSYVVTPSVVAELKKQKFPPKALNALPTFYNANPFDSATALFQALEGITKECLTITQQDALSAAASRNTIGPSVTDTPIRQAVYFGNNAKKQSGKPVYGMLASYDDESFTSFWRELEIGPNEQKRIPSSDNDQPLVGPRKVPARMVKMLRKQLAELHYGPNSDYSDVPEPLEAAYIDWSLPPFNAGYHAWAAHFDIADVQQKIRKPSQLIEGADADIFIVGEAYSNDQAWVEGAYCTAESVLNDFFGIEPLIDNCHYPFICKPV